MRPELVIVHPSAARATLICSPPTAVPRTNTVKLSWAAALAATPDVAATINAMWRARLEWHEGMLTAYTAAREGAAFLDRSSAGRILITGVDRAGYLQGLLTNDIAALKAGDGCYAAYLTAQGRMITDMHVYELGERILMTLPPGMKDAVLARLDHLIFAEDVRLDDATSMWAQIAIVGPASADVIAQLLSEVTARQLASLREHGTARVTWSRTPAVAARTGDVGSDGFDVFVASETRGSLIDALRANDIPELTASEAEVLRIEAGIPRFHQDMDEQTIPLEANLASRAISFTKGCYVGQEVIVRVLHRGHGRVARKLVGLRVEGPDVPQSGAEVHAADSAGAPAADKTVGHVTSAAFSPRLNQPIALAYVRREFVDPGARVIVERAPATVTTLPFV